MSASAAGYQAQSPQVPIFHKDPHCSVQLVLGHLSHEHDKKGISAVQLARRSASATRTACDRHKIRKAMEDRDQHYTLRGLVEVDEGYVGGEEHGEPRKGPRSRNKAVVAVAVEHSAQGQPGRPPVPIRGPVGLQRRLQQSGWLPQGQG